MSDLREVSNNQHTILLDISLFVLDMLSPEKIRSKYSQQDDGIVLEVPSAFITLIVDAQAGNRLLKRFINANIIAVKNNPIHKQSREPKILELVNSTSEKLEELSESIYQTILTDFAPLIKDISKTDRLVGENEGLASAIYPIKVYEPLIPISQDELRLLRLAYFQELNLSSHPLFDLYFLQIYHAQTSGLSETLLRKRELLSVGRTTYKTLAVWKQRLFGNREEEHAFEFRASEASPVVDSSKELLRILVTNYFREKWVPIVDTTISLLVDLVLTIPKSGMVAPDDLGLVLVGLHSVKFIVKGITKKDEPLGVRFYYIFVGILMIVCVFMLYPLPQVFSALVKFYSAPTTAVVYPQFLPTVSDIPQSTFTLEPAPIVVVTTVTLPIIEETPTIITMTLQRTIQSADTSFCMYVVQPGDSIQSVASRFRISEEDIRSQNTHVALNIFVVNQMVKINAACCAPIDNKGFSYTVQPQDNLYSLSKRFSIAESAIVSANNLYNARYIQTGQMLCIPSP